MPDTGGERMTKSSQNPCSPEIYSLVGGKGNNQVNSYINVKLNCVMCYKGEVLDVLTC